jgi:RNA polymerase sigma-70 factor (ECF subfamily)
MQRLSLDDLQSLYVRQRVPLLNYLARRTADPEVALELLAETFAHAVASRDRFKPSGEDQAVRWLYGIAKNKLADFYRRGRCEQRALQALGVRMDEPSDELLAEVTQSAGLNELRSDLATALHELSPTVRAAVELRVVDELSYAELAQRLRISEGAARVRVSRGLSALAERLNRYEEAIT